MKPGVFYRLGLCGFPLGHSLSPELHQAALSGLGLQGEYCLYPVPPLPAGEAGLRNLIAQLRRGDLHGINMTIPHKQAVLTYADELTPAARQIGAVNTLYMRNGRLVGENTDAPGFLVDLDSFARQAGRTWPTNPGQAKMLRVSRDRYHALIFGSGGAARAVAWALIDAGWQVSLAARRFEIAAAIIKDFSGLCLDTPLQVHRLAFEDLQSIPMPIDLIVNATPVGMSPNSQDSPWPAGLPLPPHACVYDLVYNPAQTVLVKTARVNGLPAVTGLGMLIEQAALAFQAWTGIDPPRQALWNAVASN